MKLYLRYFCSLPGFPLPGFAFVSHLGSAFRAALFVVIAFSLFVIYFGTFALLQFLVERPTDSRRRRRRRRRCWCYLLANNGNSKNRAKVPANPLTFQINWLNFMTLHHATAANSRRRRCRSRQQQSNFHAFQAVFFVVWKLELFLFHTQSILMRVVWQGR